MVINLVAANKTTKTVDKNYFVQIHVMNRLRGFHVVGYGCDNNNFLTMFHFIVTSLYIFNELEPLITC